MAPLDVLCAAVSLHSRGVDPLAIYAAIVGTVGLGWQIWREVRRMSTHVRVELEQSSQVRGGPFVSVGADVDPRPEPVEYEIAVVVINDGETTEYLRNVWLENAARTEGYDFRPDDRSDRELPPRSRIQETVRLPELSLDLSNGMVGIARLASGRIVESEVEPLDQSILDHIAEFNADARP